MIDLHSTSCPFGSQRRCNATTVDM